MPGLPNRSEQRTHLDTSTQPDIQFILPFAEGVLPNQAMTCPNCGDILGFVESGQSSLCPSCHYELMPRDEARTQMLIDRTHLQKCLNHPEWLAKYPALDLLNRRRIHLSHLSHSVIEGSFYWLTASHTKSDAEVETKAVDIREKVRLRQSLIDGITNIPDAEWFFMNEEIYGRTRPKIGCIFAHPGGYFSLVTIVRERDYEAEYSRREKAKRAGRELTAEEEKNEYYYQLSIKRFMRAPRNVSDFTEMMHAWPEENTDVTTSDEMVFSSYRQAPTERQLNGNARREEYYDLARALDAQEDQLLQRINAIIDAGSDNVGPEASFRDHPKVDQQEARLIDDNYFLDKKLSQGMSIQCSHCGAAIRGYEGQRSFFKCSACQGYTDLVETGRVSPQLLETCKPSETFVPADYFFELLLRTERDGGPKAGEILRIMSQEQIQKRYSAKPGEDFIFVDSLSRVVVNRPHMFTYYRFHPQYSNEYERDEGFVMNIIFPEASTVQVATGNGYIEMVVPAEVRGKILCISLGDFDDGGVKEPNERWCRVRTKLYATPGFDDRFRSNVDSWGNQMIYGDKGEVEKHWLESFDFVVESPFNDPEVGEAYRRLEATLAQVPLGSRFLNSEV